MASTPDAFAARLTRIAAQVEARADVLEDRWGSDVAQEMRARVPVRTGRLRESIQQTAPGVVTVGAPYGVYVDRGTSKMPPQEFVRPAVNAERRKIVDEGGEAALSWLLGR
jgi:HK97 gp10 family phage protein